jgi:replication protein O
MALLIPNSTQVPNFLMDELLPIVDSAEWKVISFICRKTYGWQKREDRISLSQFESGTGVSRPWLVKILDRLTGSGLLLKTRNQRGDVYGLNLESDSENVKRILQRPRLGELSSPVKPVNQSTQLTKTGELSFKTGELTLPTKQTKTKPRNLWGGPARATRIPEDFAPSSAHRSLAHEKGVDLDEELERFRDHFRAKAGRDATKLDWDAAFRNWIRKAGEWKGNNGNRGTSDKQSGVIAAAAARLARDVA